MSYPVTPERRAALNKRKERLTIAFLAADTRARQDACRKAWLRLDAELFPRGH